MSNTYALDVPFDFPVRPAFPSGNPAATEETLRQQQQQANMSHLSDRVDRAKTAYARLPVMRPVELMPRKRRTLEYDRVWQERVPIQQKADALLLGSRPVFAEWGERERQLRSDALILPISQIARQSGIDARRMNDPLAIGTATAHVNDPIKHVSYALPLNAKNFDDVLRQTTVPVQFGQTQMVHLNPDDSMQQAAVFGRLGHMIPYTHSTSRTQQFFTPVMGGNGPRDPYQRAAQSVLFRPYIHYAQ
jgi:hypothetical protein